MSDDAPPTFLESNKPEAERCVEMAAAAWKAGDLARAERMLSKSLRLYPTVQAQRLIAELNADIERQTAREQSRQEHQRQAAQEAAQERARQERQQQQQHYQQQQQQSYSRPQQRPTAQSTPTKSASAPPPSSSSSPHPAGAAYTQEQSESARLIISKAKDYYAIFSVKRTATESEIKSSYRKLALKFHPDKNKAPEAEEAFKVVNSAFQTLSDASKRAHYDAYGVDEPQGARPSRAHQYERSDDMSPEEIFNAFFNGSFNMGPGGGARRTYTFRRPQQQQRQQQDDSPAAFIQQIMHFLPILLLLLFGLMSAPSGDEQVFNLSHSSSFPVQRMTKSAGVNAGLKYFVDHTFDRRYGRDIRALAQVEHAVEAQTFKLAEEQCQKQKRAYAEEERKAKKDLRGEALAKKLQAMSQRSMDACDRLNSLRMNAHGATAG